MAVAIPRHDSRMRWRSLSYARSPITRSGSGTRSGAPGLPRTGGIASTSGSNCVRHVVAVGRGERAGQRDAAGVATSRWCLLPRLRRSTGLGPVFSPVHGTDRGGVDDDDDDAAEVDAVGPAQPVQQQPVQGRPHPGLHPLVQAVPQRHAAAAHLLREVLPRDAGLEHEQDAGQADPVGDARGLPPLGLGSWRGRIGSTNRHNSSGTNSLPIASSVTETGDIVIPAAEHGKLYF